MLSSFSKRNVGLFSHGPRISVGDVDEDGFDDGCEDGEVDTSSVGGCVGCCDGPDDIIAVGVFFDLLLFDSVLLLFDSPFSLSLIHI